MAVTNEFPAGTKVRTSNINASSIPVVSATTDVVTPFTGQIVFATTDNTLYRYNGSSWVVLYDADDTSHEWTGSVSAGNAFATVTNWSQSNSAGIATMASSTTLTLNRAGKWALTLKCSSDAGLTGVEQNKLVWSSGPWSDSALLDTRWRGSGFAGAGGLASVLSWTGYVSTSQATQGITAQALWNPSSGSSAITHTMVLLADYLGG